MVRRRRGDQPGRSSGTLDVLPAGAPVRQTADVLSSAAMRELVEMAVGAYDLVLIDSPPVLNLPDAQALAALPIVDTVLVLGARQRQRRLRRALRQLERTGVRTQGVVMNGGAVDDWFYGA